MPGSFTIFEFAVKPRCSNSGTGLFTFAGKYNNKSAFGPSFLGAATGVAPIVVTTAAPTTTTDAQIQTWLAGQLDGTHAEFGTPDPNAIYTIFYPQSTTISDGQAGTSCQDYGGYHSETKIGSTIVAYAVLPRCPGGFNGSMLDSLTTATSHEWIEAATDPHPRTRPAYTYPDDDHIAWLLFPMSEVGDMCTYTGGNTQLLDIGGLQVQRSWSNASAKAYHDPCVPKAVAEPYFNATPDAKEDVGIDLGGGDPYPTKGVKVPLGQTKTVDVLLWSDAKTSGPFTVHAFDAARFQGGKGDLGVSLDRDSGVNGEKLHLTITRNKNGQYGGSILVLMNSLGSRRSLWTTWVAN